MSGNRVLRIAGLVLVLSILPLTVFAAVSMGTRVAQHGLSPERLWGVIAIAVAVAYGLAWLVAVVRGWKAGEWRERVRRANLHLAVVICGLALFLALPILDFGAISARQQIARLQTGAVSADKFDYDALRWDFGVAGRRALTRLVGSGNPKVARLAKSALAQQRRAYGPIISPDEYRLRVQPNDPELRRLAIEYFQATPIVCFDECVVIELGKTSGGGRRVAIVQNISYHTVVLGIGRPGWRETKPELPVLKVGSKVEIRELTKRFIVVDGKPLDRPLDDEPSPLEGAPPSR